MTGVLEFLPEAKDDADEATRFYERHVSGLGARFRAEVESVCGAIARQPLLWRERPEGYRRVNLPGFLTMLHTSSAASVSWSRLLAMPVVIPTTGSGANPEFVFEACQLRARLS